MKDKTWWLSISAVLILGTCFTGTGFSWAADSGPPLTGAVPDAQTVAAQTDAAAPTTPAGTGTPAQTQTTPPATPAAATTTTTGTQNVPTTEVTVTAEKEKKPKEGSAEAGYKVENTTTTGPWGQMKLQDTPYSISVMPSELIENVVAGDPDQLLKMNPLTQFSNLSSANNIPSAYIRGFYAASPLHDGIPTDTGYGIALENIERVEIKTGLGGFLYGPGQAGGQVGGQVNYVTKRPTQERLDSITVGNYGGSQYFVHGDFGGPIDKEGKFGYRVNLMDQPEGDTALQYQRLQRDLFAGAFDWHAMDNLLLQVNYEHQDYNEKGTPAVWLNLNPGVPHSSAPDADKSFGQKWSFNTMTTDSYGTNAKWDINDMFTFRAGYRHQEDSRAYLWAQNSLRLDGRYDQRYVDSAPQLFLNDGYYQYLDSKFTTGPIEHKLTAGFSANTYVAQYHLDTSAIVSGPPLNYGTLVPEPVFPAIGTKPWYTGSTQTAQNMIIGDDIRFNEQWSALVGVNDARIEADNHPIGSKPTFANKSADTPSASLIYKPIPWISTYATYMESLEQGTIVLAGYSNTGAVLDPLVSKQYEIGAKATVGRVLLTTALFRIDKANQYSIPTTPLPTYVQDGREVHQGVEFTATGKVTDRLTLLGGFTLMDCTVEKTASASLVGKEPVNVADQYAKLYAEYNLPWINGLTLTGGIFYTGTQWADAANTDLLPAYTVGDVGARYTTQLNGYTTIFRLYVSNVTDKSYWDNANYVGAPRTIAFSAQVKF